MSNIIKGLLPTGKAPSVLKAEIIELIGQNAPSKEEFENMDALPAGGVSGQVLTRVGSSNADWVNAPGTSIQAVTSPARNTVRVTLTNGQVTDIPVEVATVWSKENQAKVQGYWEVVSEAEPAESTYTLRDGTVLPVKWTRPVSKVVPVFPETPAWNDYEQSVLVPSLVGVEYRIAGSGQKLPSGQWVRIPGATPKDVTVEAVAAPGYRLLSSVSWTHSFPNPNQVTVFTSDSFNRANTGARGITATDISLGGTVMPWGWVEGENNLDDFADAVVRIEGKKLVLKPYSSWPGEVRRGRVAGLKLEGVPENWRVSFNLEQYQNVVHGQALSLAVSGYGPKKRPVQFEFYGHYNIARVQVRYPNEQSGHDELVTVLDGLPAGAYVLEKFRSSVRVKHPGGERSISLPGFDGAATARPALSLYRPLNQAKDQDRQIAAISNFKVEKLGF